MADAGFPKAKHHFKICGADDGSGGILLSAGHVLDLLLQFLQFGIFVDVYYKKE